MSVSPNMHIVSETTRKNELLGQTIRRVKYVSEDDPSGHTVYVIVEGTCLLTNRPYSVTLSDTIWEMFRQGKRNVVTADQLSILTKSIHPEYVRQEMQSIAPDDVIEDTNENE